jgi:hypothetical protein
MNRQTTELNCPATYYTEPLAKLSFRSLRLPAQTLRYAQNFILGGKHPLGVNSDSDIKYMPVVKFFACRDFE